MMRLASNFQYLLVVLLLVGCDPAGSSPQPISGHFEGSLTNHLDGTSYSQTAVNTDLGIVATKSPGAIDVKDQTKASAISLFINNASDNSLNLRSTLGIPQGINLTRLPDSFCYTGVEETKVTLCLSSQEISLEIQNKTTKVDLLFLVLRPFSTTDTVPAAEQPKIFTLSEAIDIARNKSFTSRIQFEHMVQAKARSRAAYLHLLPQLTINTVTNLITPSFTSILAAIGDLAPFLLPDRWIQADAASKFSNAEKDISLLMKLDMGAQVEGLYYAYARDSKTRDLTQDILIRATTIRDEVKIREDLGLLAQGSTANMNSIINQIHQSLEVFDQVLTEDLASISQTLGFYSPSAVRDATIDLELVPIDLAKPMDYTTVNTAALSRSYELDQMDNLIAASHDTKSAAFFSWMDPYGDPSLGLGFALSSQITVLDSQAEELKVNRQQLQSIISQKAFNGTTDYKQALQSYKTAMDGMMIQQSRLDTVTNNLKLGVKIDFFGLVGILQDYLNGEISIEVAKANYRVARAQIDRLLLQGYYAKF